MRLRALFAAALIALAACGGGGDPTVPAGQDDSGLITENVERAREVADQVDQRESQLEQIVEEMGG
jgi:hypothetical protein